MAITAAQAVRHAVKNIRPMIADEKVAAAAGTQAGAPQIASAFTRVTQSSTPATAGSSLVLPNLISNEAGGDFYVVANQSGATIAVFCALGDTLNNSANGSLTIADNGFGVFVKEFSESYSYVAPDWAAAAFT